MNGIKEFNNSEFYYFFYFLFIKNINLRRAKECGTIKCFRLFFGLAEGKS